MNRCARWFMPGVVTSSERPPTKILIAPDSFKESLTARQAARAIADGFRAVVPLADLVELPAGDGGEGTAEALFDQGIVAVHSIVRRATTLPEALAHAEENLRFAARNLAATWYTGMEK